MLILLVGLLMATVAVADRCTDCVNSGKNYCATIDNCGFEPCPGSIKNLLNCPSVPAKPYEYSDEEARTKWLPLFISATNENPAVCLRTRAPTVTFYNKVSVDCPSPAGGPNENCFMYTAYDTTQKIIVMSFRGTNGNAQLYEEFLDFLRAKVPFFDSGNVYEYFYDAFLDLWNAGLGNDLKTLKYRYPDYQLWVTGHSLGGAMASVAASYAVKTGLYSGQNVRLLTVGQPRTGDYDYAYWHQNTFPYSYRVVHAKDIVPHLPPQPALNGDTMFHHRTEIWYNNNMTVGSPYNVCKEADGMHCSNTQLDTSAADHGVYYGVQLWCGEEK